MSFGSAAAHRGRRPPAQAPCPCGSGAAFSHCCGPVLDGDPAKTPESLMRSRYTAFVVGDLTHLERSWHPTTRPADLTLDDDQRWRGLDILRTHTDGARGMVEFRARWRDARTGESGHLHETSRFRQISGLWFYVDGDVT